MDMKKEIYNKGCVPGSVALKHNLDPEFVVIVDDEVWPALEAVDQLTSELLRGDIDDEGYVPPTPFRRSWPSLIEAIKRRTIQLVDKDGLQLEADLITGAAFLDGYKPARVFRASWPDLLAASRKAPFTEQPSKKRRAETAQA